MCGTVTYRRMADGSEKMYKNYRCNFKAQSKLCDRGKTYREADLEEYMLAHIRPALSDYIAKYEVTAASTVQKNPVTEIAKIERKMKKLYDLFMDDLIDKEAYRSEYDKFKAQIKELQKCSTAAPMRSLDSVKKLLSEDWEAVYHTFSDQEKNTFWKSFVESVLVYEDGSMDIRFL